MDKNFVLDLVSVVDYIGDIKAYLYKCETESSPCDIQYLKDKVADIMFDLNSIIDRIHKPGDTMTNTCTSVEDLITLTETVFSALPDKLDKQSITVFSDICEYVDNLCNNNPNLYWLLMPFCHLTFGWQSAYGKGFTWQKFLQEMLDSDCTEVSYVSSHGDTGPSLYFSKNRGADQWQYFCIKVVHDD